MGNVFLQAGPLLVQKNKASEWELRRNLDRECTSQTKNDNSKRELFSCMGERFSQVVQRELLVSIFVPCGNARAGSWQTRFFADFDFWAAGCFFRFCRQIFLVIFAGISGQRNPPGEALAKSSNFHTTNIPDTFLQSGRAKAWAPPSTSWKQPRLQTTRFRNSDYHPPENFMKSIVTYSGNA